MMTDDTVTCPDPLAGWLEQAVRMDASDLHMVAGHAPIVRVHGRLQVLEDCIVTDDAAIEMLQQSCPADIWAQFQDTKDMDFSLSLPIDGLPRRFRGNYFFEQGHIGSCFRVIPAQIPDFAWSGFPEELARRLATMRDGLVLFSGITGSGKTTTLAMIIQVLNLTGGYRIITVEEPIEYLFDKASTTLITQREVGRDVGSFADGLKYGLRQDPDVILVGEIRDRETAHMALSAAETGHLVFSTLHTRDAKGAISRFTDLFPHDVQADIRGQLSMSLRAVISQHLLDSVVPDSKRELALEVMFNNLPIAAAIRTGRIETIDTNILTGRAAGMVPLHESLKNLLLRGLISKEEALRYISDPEMLK